MTILEDVSFNSQKNRRRISGRKSMLILSDDEDDEDYDTAVGIKPKSRKSAKIYVGSDDDDDDDSYPGGDDDDSDGYLSPLEHDKENQNSQSQNRNRNMEKRKNHPDSSKKGKNKGAAAIINSKKTPNPKPKKRRRRSSARFLRLSGRFGDEDADNENDAPEAEQLEKLNDMYSKAIQLNAANKINAVNSWGLNIIDKMDKFLGDDDVDADGTSASPIDVEDDVIDKENPTEEGGNSSSNGQKKRVNFTKASCTIDACVKIYSYRVDDAHLTSYKVLANLNRTDGGKQNTTNDIVDTNGDNLDEEEENDQLNTRRRQSVAAVKTVETNMAALNISNLDSAYDIDPIFHKLSQKFDEGGAKGLLLVNLGVANDGCRIVLDSKEDIAEGGEPALEDEDIDDTEEHMKEGMIDISSLVQTLQSKMPSSPMESIHFVPQLEELRQTYAVLEEEGFAEAGKAMESKSFRYANDAAEDKAAEDEIHREALERSTASGIQQRTSFMLPNTSLMTHNVSMLIGQNRSNDYDDDDDNDYGGCDDYDDGDDDDFDNLVAMDDHAEKYSSDSFRNDLTMDASANSTEHNSSLENSGPTTFLDEICAGDALTKGGSFNYFNPDLIEKLTSGNQWAGSAHWKKNQNVRLKRSTKKIGEEIKRKDQKQKRKSTKISEPKLLVDFDIPSYGECLKDLLKSTKKSQRGKGTKDKNLMTKATKQKCDKDKNLLPFDAGMNANHFTEFFMRPGTSIGLTQKGDTGTEPKTVGFSVNESDQYDNGVDNFDDGVDDSYDDGPGFDLADDNNIGEFNDNDNYAIQELEGIRKVEKVRVGHATVSKKVDVKRLKKDLWVQLEKETTAPAQEISDEEKMEFDAEDEDESNINSDNIVSFKDTVTKLGATEAQEDVSLPFYFICVLHLANEKGLKLDNGDHGLADFVISRDNDVSGTNH